jgi:hypothetical protein
MMPLTKEGIKDLDRLRVERILDLIHPGKELAGKEVSDDTFWEFVEGCACGSSPDLKDLLAQELV